MFKLGIVRQPYKDARKRKALKIKFFNSSFVVKARFIV